MAFDEQGGTGSAIIRDALTSIESLKDTLKVAMKQESDYQNRIKELELQLRKSERAWSSLDHDYMKLKSEYIKLEKKTQFDLENSVKSKGHRISVLLDGDGAIFATDLILRGSNGGQEAAQLLSEAIAKFLETNYENHQYEIWVKLFLNKRGLLDVLGRTVGQAEKSKFEDFLIGFNQASDHFIVVDVGNVKEGADSKIKAHLDDDLRIPQTEKVIFGGCHDNGYVSSLRSQITNGYRSKLVLLKSYAQAAKGIADLGLPEFSIPGLFMTVKLPNVSVVHDRYCSTAKPPGPPLSPVLHTRDIDTIVTRNGTPTSTVTEICQEDGTKRLSPLQPSMLPSSSYTLSPLSSKPSCKSDTMPRISQRSQPIKLSPNFSLAELNLERPPCNDHYLNSAGCMRGAECGYSHHYLLFKTHCEELKATARNTPCTFVNDDRECPRDSCFYGHSCPSAPNCHYFKQGTCRFRGANMHTAPSSWRK